MNVDFRAVTLVAAPAVVGFTLSPNVPPMTVVSLIVPSAVAPVKPIPVPLFSNRLCSTTARISRRGARRGAEQGAGTVVAERRVADEHRRRVDGTAETPHS